jgi:hypothetical protein
MESKNWNDALKGLESYYETPPVFVKENIDKVIAAKSAKNINFIFFSVLMLVLLVDGYSNFWGVTNAKVNTTIELNTAAITTVQNSKGNGKVARDIKAPKSLSVTTYHGNNDGNISFNQNKEVNNDRIINNVHTNPDFQKKSVASVVKITRPKSINESTGRQQKNVEIGSERKISNVPTNELTHNNITIGDNIDKNLYTDNFGDTSSEKSNTIAGNIVAKPDSAFVVNKVKEEVKLMPLVAPKVKSKKNEFTLIGGPLFALSKTRFDNPELSMKSQKGVLMDLSYSRAITAKLKVQVGGGFQKWNEKVTQDHVTSVTTNTPAITSYIYGLDTTGGPATWVVIDSTITPASSVTVDSHSITQSESFINRFSLRTAISYDFTIAGNWSYTLNIGHLLNVNSMRIVTANVATIASSYTKFTGTMFIDNSINYKINDIVFRAGIHTGLDYKPSLNWNAINKKRTYISPFFGVSYNF